MRVFTVLQAHVSIYISRSTAIVALKWKLVLFVFRVLSVFDIAITFL